MSKIGLSDKYDLLPVTSVQVAGIRVFPRGALDDYDHAASLALVFRMSLNRRKAWCGCCLCPGGQKPASGKKTQVLPPTG